MKRLLCLVLLLTIVGCNAPDKIEYTTEDKTYECLPMTKKASPVVDCINTERLSRAERLMIMSLQGLANRDEAVIYSYNSSDDFIIPIYEKAGYITSRTEFTDVWSLVSKYSAKCSKAVLCDAEKFYQINLATNIAGVEDRIVITEDIKDRFIRTTGCSDILDLNSLGLEGPAETFRWYRKNIYPEQNNMALGLSKGGLVSHDPFLDYLISFRLPTFWLPGKKDKDYDPEYDKEIIGFLKDTPVNIPVIGFWYAVEDGTVIGYDEFPGVKEAGKYGKFTLVNDQVGNYSYHSGIRTGKDTYKQKHSADRISYSKDKKYVAMIMVESGDAPCYFMYEAFFNRQWNDPDRGKVPISYGLTPSLRYLAPGVLEHIYKTQSNNDYFFCSISGMGYCYPFEGYGTGTADRDQCLKDYFWHITSSNMKKMDLDILAIYTHPGPEKWSEDNHMVAEKYIAQMPGLRALTAGMHRTGYTGADANFTIGHNISVFNTVTHWSSQGGFRWDDTSLDEAAVEYLISEIKNNGNGGQFIQAMFYSWDYGPRRLLMLKERLEKEGYVFVTVEQLDYLFRQSKKK